ncbi:glutamate-1-semialdehyde aminotransferase [Thermanaerovibrio velox DSM 12556]|uniref:Glutamate-1-semialdehyde aminotransferase n=1 Tax=Thermanaerovibrio velox DSM 12556 TaxID=926567 RepID=H0USF4_9BACT|nr:aminotransferase class III-fold pyridoxal phosphate-dependent enzyme [Thermanaerovibrio velox]EHM10243.1 glutamate-1-semialdehyde aminotransferase [Thermanaerovibrio velox DSM 12556]
MPDINRSLKMQDRGKSSIPGMTQLLSKRPDMFSLGVWPGYYSKAKGALVWDLDGNEYLDMSISAIGASVLGYCDPDVDGAVIEAIRGGVVSSLNCPEEVELAELLCDVHPWAQMARFTRSGGEAMAVAVRIARAHTGRDKVAFCGYHGWHDWYLAANVGTENALGEHLISGLDPRGVPKGLSGTALPFRFNRVEELKVIVDSHRDDLAAVILEPIRNDEPQREFVEAVRDLASHAGAVLVVDEISSGFRLNSGGAHLLYGYEPDMAVFSKAMGNGYPIGAVIGRAEVMESAQRTFISSTCWTERTGFAAALATIRKHRALNAAEHLCRMGRMVQEGWKELLNKHSIDAHVSGIYPMSHVDFQGPLSRHMKAFYVQEMLERGILASNLFYAMLAHQDQHVDRYLKAADEVLRLMRQLMESNRLEDSLLGQPSQVGFKRLN